MTIVHIVSKLGLGVIDKVRVSHLEGITGREIDSIVWVRHPGLVLKGNVDSRRDQLKNILHDKNLT